MRKHSPVYVLFIMFGMFGCSKDTPSSNAHTYCEGFTLTCQNGGTCGEAVLNGGVYKDSCDCPLGYSGTTCEILNRQNFLGTWVGSCYNSGVSIPDTILITADTNIGYIDFVDKSKWSIGGGTSLIIPMTYSTFFSKGFYIGNFYNINYNILSVDRNAGSSSTWTFTGTKI